MMQCCVKDCGNDNKFRNISKHRITFHTFPKDPNQRAAWIKSLSLPEMTPITQKTLVCSDHFLEEEFYATTHNIRTLKKGVVPSIQNDINAPIASRVCMICLALDTKMYHLKDYNLAQMYVNVIGIQPRTHVKGELPQQVCWECRARLTSAAAFKAKAILSNSLLNDQSLKIGHILKIHQKHANLKSSLSRSQVQKIFDTEVLTDLKSNSNTKTEQADIPFNDEIEIEVNQLLTDRIQIKDEKNNLMIEEITELYDNAVKTEVDLVPITKIDKQEENYGSEDVNFNDGEATEEVCMETNDNTQATIIDLTLNEDIESTSTQKIHLNDFNINKHKVENVVQESIDNDDVIMVPNEEKFFVNIDTTTIIFNKNVQRDQTNFNSVDVSNVVSSEPKVCLDKIDIPEVKKKKAAVKRKAAKKDASVVLKRTKKQPNVKPCQPVGVSCEPKVCLDKIDTPEIKMKKVTVKKTASKEDASITKEKRKVKPWGKPVDENVFKITALSREALIQEVLNREHSLKYKQAPFKCTICFLGFPSEDKQTRHMIKHSEESGQLKCEICKIRLKKNLRAHVRLRHTDEFSCKLCPFVTRRRTTALMHMKFHAGSIYKCTQCDLEFEKKTTLLSHKRLKHISDFVCELCGYTFVSTFGVKAHKVFKHQDVDKNLELKGPYCKECDVTFLSEDAYSRHLKLSSKHLKNESDPKRLRNEPTYGPRKQITVLNPRTSKNKLQKRNPVTCEQCGEEQRTYPSYVQHFLSCHPGLSRTQYPQTTPFICEECGKMFSSVNSLSCHKWVHTGKKLFQCNHCEKSFSQKSRLKDHLKSVTEGQPIHQCSECGKKFWSSSNLKRHELIHTGMNKFECDICSKSFTTSSNLYQHKQHTHFKKPWPRKKKPKIIEENL